MNFLELAKTRFSSRKYLNNPVEKEKLLIIMETARIAPSAANKQPWLFYIIQNENSRKLISETYHREWLKAAPVIIVACADHSKGWIRSDHKDHCDIDLAIAIDHITLQAAELGLGSCWICNFDPKKCSKILNLPDYIEPIALIPVAYPADSPDINRHVSQRKQLSEIVKWEFQ